MRISTNQQMMQLQGYVERANERLANLQSQAASGRRINRVSDDPFGVNRSLTMRTVKANNQQYLNNIKHAKNFVQLSENTLAEASKMLQEVKQLALRGANGSNDQAAREALARQVEATAGQFLRLVNDAQFNGQRLFSGQQTDRAPITVSGTTVTYNGDHNPVLIEISPGQTMQVNLPGEPIFTDTYSTLLGIRDALSAGNLEALSNQSLGDIDARLSELLDARAGTGSKVRELDDLSRLTTQRNDELTAMISEVEEADIIQVISDLKSAEMAYEAALTVTSRSFGMSLMDFMRGG